MQRRGNQVRNRLFLGLLAGAALTIGLTACGSDDEDAASDTSATPQATQAAATTALTQAPAAAATQAPAAPQAVEVKMGDFYFEPKEIAVRSGAVKATLVNQAERREHTYVIKNKGGSGDLAKSSEVTAGQSVTFDFTLTEEGVYEVYCSLPGHASRGQVGTITVTAS
jgi:uncharacterized cupredoxin-like copper-binding protein